MSVNIIYFDIRIIYKGKNIKKYTYTLSTKYIINTITF